MPRHHARGKQSEFAVVAVLAPTCVNKFQHSAGAPAALVELDKMASDEQGSFVEQGGWATPPGGAADSAVAQARATMLGALNQIRGVRRPECAAPCGEDRERLARMPDRGGVMPLNFPNDSRSYDATRRAVRFWGYDSATEASFFVTYEALKHLQPDLMYDEAAAWRVFDHHRNAIYAAAAKVYARGRKGSYELTTAEF